MSCYQIRYILHSALLISDLGIYCSNSLGTDIEQANWAKDENTEPHTCESTSGAKGV